ncbi:MAG: ABC-F family ATP-binding cassette domain-containing protein [Lachnospira sp.]|nr:ABC-F family ATP-binding cassette domain-containing protein [Lachnospira sp.]
MILACNGITKAFGIDEILKDISFHINEKEKLAIVGVNGAGKSTLFKIITGQINADSGTVTLAKDTNMGYLSQHQDLISDNSIYDEMLSTKQDILLLEQKIRLLEHDMHSETGDALEVLLKTYSNLNHDFESKNGYAYKSEVTGILRGLGFMEEDFNRPINTLSGGQKTRIALGKLLISKPELLLLDEPTNHLDLPSIAWLENYLLNYQGSVILISHDRYFLDRIVSKIVEIENGKSICFNGNYTEYSKKKAQLMDAKMKEYYNNQREIKHQEEVIKKLKEFNREKSIKRAESREKLLNKMEVVERPLELNAKMRITLEPEEESGNDVLSVNNLAKAYNTPLFSNISFDIKRGERVALIGANGTGKTTILKIINGIIDTDCGSVKLGSRVNIGYYDQEHNILDMDKTLFEEISDAYPHLTNTKIRNTLAAFLFTDDDVFKKISQLSGGERGRISLAKLMLSNANFLILDEPTNHLDLISKEILESALNSYTGTILYVSHDRFFINSTATRILDLENNSITNYIGNYDYYIEKKKEIITPTTATTHNAEPTANKLNWQQSKEQQAKERKRKNDLEKLEKNIEKLETRIAQIDELLTCEDVYTDVPKLLALQKEKEGLDEELLQAYEQWETLSE